MGVSVFISYAKPDSSLARDVADRLARSGFQTMLADDQPLGSKWADALRSQVERSDAAVFIASDASLKSGHVMLELGAYTQTKKPIFAIQPSGAEPPSPSSPFSLVQTIDAGRFSPDEIANQIAAKLEPAV